MWVIMGYCVGQVAQRVCGVSLIEDIQEPSEHNPVLCTLGWPCLSRDVGLDEPSVFPSNLTSSCDSVAERTCLPDLSLK